MPSAVNLPPELATQAPKAITGVAVTDIITSTAHGLKVGDAAALSGLSGGAGLANGQVLYVIAANLAANTFQLSTTFGGATVDFTTDITAGFVTKVLNWFNIKSYFTPEQFGYLAKYYATSFPLLNLADGTIVDNNVVRSFYQTGSLPV